MKATITDVTYISNPKTTICIIKIRPLIYSSMTEYDLLYKSTFKGIAKLKDGDQSDPVLAKRIAESKAKRALYKYLRSIDLMVWSRLKKHVQRMALEYDKDWDLFKQETNHLLELTNVL